MSSARKRPRRASRTIFRRRKRHIQIGKPSRGLRQSTYLFKRRITTVVELSNSDSGGWISAPDNKSMYKQWNFKLQDLAGVDSTDFTNLFRRYKINSAKVELAFSNTSSAPLGGGSGTNCQLQIYTRANRSGRSEELITEQNMLNTQASKKRLCLNNGRPIKYYMKLNQLNQTFANTGGVPNTDYTTQRPQYVSTQEVGCEHYGLDMFINRVDGEALGSNLASAPQVMRCTITYYMSFKGVE